MQAILFYIFAAVTVASAVGVVVSKNIVRTAVQLLFTLLGVAGIYFLLGAEFLAAVQLVIYVGGTLVLIIFGVMLTARASLMQLSATRTEKWATAVAAALLLVALIAAVCMERLHGQSRVADHYAVNRLGQSLLGDYLLPFELSSVLLLAVMIGAAYLAKRRARPAEKGKL
jgi:NADH-quinone oxidoreductase subunit J